MAEYDNAIALAKRLIAKKGDVCQWRKRGGAGPYQVSICFVSQGNIVDLIASSLGADSSQNRGSFDALMPTVEFKPEQGDMVIRSDGTQLIVGNMNEFKPGAQSIMFFIKFGA